MQIPFPMLPLIGIRRPASVLAFCGTLTLVAAPVAAQDARLLVTVVEGFGRPMAGVDVVVLDEDSRAEVRSGITDSSGLAALSIPSGRRYRIVVHVDGFYGRLPDPDDSNAPCCPETAAVVVERVIPSSDIPVTIPMAPLRPEEPLVAPQPRPPVPKGVLRGTVVNTLGEPLARAQIQVWQGYTMAARVETNRRGVYHAVLPAGEYRVEASGPSGDMRAASFTHYGSAQFPGVVRIRGGRNTAGVTITLAGEEHFGMKISIRDGIRHTPATAKVTISNNNTLGKWDAGPRGIVNVPPRAPGRYTITARGTGDHAGLAAMMDVDVTARQEVTVTLLPGARASGRVEFEGRERPLHSRGTTMQVITYPAGHLAATQSSDDLDGVVDGHGRFTLDARVGEQCVTVLSLPAGWNVGQVTYAGRDVTDEPLPFAPGDVMSDLVITVVPQERPVVRPTCGKAY